MPAMRPRRSDRYLVEWLLFMLVALISLRTAWLIHGVADIHDFFWSAWDGLGHYQWLPSAFITQNFDGMFWSKKINDHQSLSLYSLGVSVLEMPFFLASQWLTWFFGYPSTGFSPPNGVAMMVSAATYTGAGAVFSYKLARRFSSVPAALLAVLSIFACTNLFYYATQEPLMSHVYSYFLISLFCWCGLRIIDGPRPWHVFAFLFSGALLVLIRPLNVVVFLFPLWMAWTSPSGLRGSWEYLLLHKKALLIGVVAGVIPWLLQMLYWHHLTGSFYVNPYAFVGEHFEWDRMVPGLVLFSPRNGWFVYSPIFLVVVAALLVQAWRNKRYARPLLFILLFTVLIYSAWWCWWLGGGFGYRGLVDLYGLLAIPFAVFFRSLLRRSWSLRIFAAVLICVLIRLNFGMIEHRDFDIYNVNTEWPPLLEVVGDIAAGN